MLEFVLVSGASGEKDLQTRKKVRSQAMRDFRRRQREERQAGKTGGRSHNNRLSTPDSRSVSPSCPGRQRATSTSSISTNASSARMRQSRSAASPGPTPFVSQKDGESSFQAIPITQVAPTTQMDASAVDALENWQLDPQLAQIDLLSTYWEPGIGMGTPALNVTQEQYVCSNNAEYSSIWTTQIGQMLDPWRVSSSEDLMSLGLEGLACPLNYSAGPQHANNHAFEASTQMRTASATASGTSCTVPFEESFDLFPRSTYFSEC